MRLQGQLSLLLLFVALVPVSVSGVTSSILSRGALERAQTERLSALARHTAEQADSYVANALTDLRLSSQLLRTPGLNDAERAGALRLVHQQRETFNIAALVDARGDGVGAPVFDATPGRDPVDDAALELFSTHIPLAAALKTGAAIGPPYAPKDGSHPRIALAVAVPLGDGQGVVAVELSLRPLQERLQDAARDGHGTAWITDGNGRPIAGAHDGKSPLRVPGAAELTQAMQVQDAQAMLRQDLSGHASFLSLWRLERLPWTAMVAQDEASALATANNILAQTGFWIVVAILCALLAGTVLARAFSAPVMELVRTADAFSRAEFHHRAPALKPREFNNLADAFNRMASEVQRRDDELRAFNEQLQQRVEERTRDLKEAQDQLIQSQKMAAVGELGAGVAHEINNPLAGLVGLIQLRLLRASDDDPTTQTFKDMEKEALRIRDIVQNLLALTPQKGAGETVVDVNRLLEGSLGLMTRPIVAARIQVKKELDGNLPKIRARSADLQQAVMAVLANACTAMPDGGVLTVTTQNIDSKLVKLSIEDTGAGIPPEIMDRIFEPFFTTKPTPDSKGLGLALVHRVVQDHGGRLSVDSEPGRGARFSITLTAARDRMHLV